MADWPARLDEHLEAMKEFYPQFSLSGLPIGTGPLTLWRGRIQPVRAADELDELLDDLLRDRDVRILQGGELVHQPGCAATHVRHEWRDTLTDPLTSYKFEIRLAGGKAHPRGYVLDPPIPPDRRRHFYDDGSICPYPPWQGVWRWDVNTVADYLDHASVWLLRWTVWSQTGVWPGEEMPHDLPFLLRAIGPNQECWCRSGEKYKRCCQRRDQERVRRPRPPYLDQ